MIVIYNKLLEFRINIISIFSAASDIMYIMEDRMVAYLKRNTMR